MKSLIRNDLRWALPLALIGTLVHLLAMVLNYNAADFWILPTTHYPEVSLGFHSTSALLVALWAFFFDDLFRTREYLHHRPQSFRRLFWVRHAVGLGVVAAWALLVPTLHLLGSWVLSPNAILVDESRWGLFVAQGVPALLFYAVPVFLASTAQTVLGGALLALTGVGVAVVAIVLALMYEPSLILTSSLCLVSTAILLVGAEHNRAQGPDPDRPWLNRRLILAGTVFLIVASIVGALTLTLGQTVARAFLLDAYPQLFDNKGATVLAKWFDDEGVWRRVDEQHRPGEVLPGDMRMLFAPGQATEQAFPLPRLARQPVFPYDNELFRGKAYRPVSSGWTGINRGQGHLGQDGYLHLYRLANRHWEGAPWMKRIGKGSEGRPFSPRTLVLDSWQRTVLLADPDDGGVWAYYLDGDAPGFSRLELPGGDRFVRSLEARLQRGPTREYLPEPTVVRGERGTYVWHEGRFVAAAPTTPGGATFAAASVSPFELIPTERPRAEISREGSVGLRVSFLAPGGEMIHQAFRPHTFQEHALALTLRAQSLLRPTLVSVPSLFASTTRLAELGLPLLLDRNVVLGERATFAGNLLVTLLLAGLAFRRLGRLGVARGRRIYWASAILLGGATIYLCHLMIERRRAWNPMPAEPEGHPAPSRLLVQGA